MFLAGARHNNSEFPREYQLIVQFSRENEAKNAEVSTVQAEKLAGSLFCAVLQRALS
jgi:hypothetical protein